jgi:arylsulfatase A-like enzyme
MNPIVDLDLPGNTDSEKAEFQQPELRFRPVLALVTILALVSSSLEIELLEHLDSLSLFMTYREIASDAGVALLVVLTLGVLWWVCIMLVAGIFATIPSLGPHRTSLVWRLGLVLPVAYFLADLCDSIMLRVRPQHHMKLSAWTILGASLFVICILSMSVVTISRIQSFCGSRLVPVGYFHIALGIIALIVLRADGVYLFHDYAGPGKSVETSVLPDIYLISFDALRAGDTSVYGYDRPTTPNLERFAEQSFTFDYFFANSNFTTPTTTSMETGLLPWSHRVFQGGGFLRQGDKAADLPVILRQHGYYTAMISSNLFAGPFRHKTMDGYDAVEYLAPSNFSGAWSRWMNLIGANTQYTLSIPLLRILTGIRQYMDVLLLPDRYQSAPEGVLNRGRVILERRDIDQPRFVWMHILPPHDPYLPPAPYRGRFLQGSKLSRNFDFLDFRNSTLPPGVSSDELRARYDEMILYADHAVGTFLDWLDQTGRLQNAVVIVSADHGESFEHNWFSHTGPYLYDSLIHIPFIIHLPGQRQGVHNSQLAQQADLMPTILDLIGVKPSTEIDGTSLVPALKGEAVPQRYVFSMNLEQSRIFDPITKGTIAVMDDQFKYVNYLDRHQEALYRYKSDLQEEHDLSSSEPEVTKRLRDVLLGQLKVVNQPFAAQR